MANMSSKSKLEFKVILELDESEVKALDALAGYGHEEFLKVFYEKMGVHYLKPHEEGLISVFNTIRRELPAQISKIDKTKELWRK